VRTDEEISLAVGIALPIQTESLSGKMHRTASNRDRQRYRIPDEFMDEAFAGCS